MLLVSGKGPEEAHPDKEKAPESPKRSRKTSRPQTLADALAESSRLNAAVEDHEAHMRALSASIKACGAAVAPDVMAPLHVVWEQAGEELARRKAEAKRSLDGLRKLIN